MEKDTFRTRALIRRAQAGDETAFEVLVRELEGPVFRAALSLLRVREDAEDAASETFIKLWRTLPEYRFDCPIRPFVLTIVRHTALDYLRRRSREPVLLSLTPDPEAETEAEWDLPDTDISADPVSSYGRKELAEAVRRGLEELSEGDREILQLREFEQCSYEEIACILQVEEGTVKSRLFRARKNLRKILESRNIFG